MKKTKDQSKSSAKKQLFGKNKPRKQKKLFPDNSEEISNIRYDDESDLSLDDVISVNFEDFVIVKVSRSIIRFCINHHLVFG